MLVQEYPVEGVLQPVTVVSGAHEVGIMTSGTFAPSFDRPLGMAYLAAAAGAPASVEVEIRSRRVAAAVTGLPFYRRGKPPAA